MSMLTTHTLQKHLAPAHYVFQFTINIVRPRCFLYDYNISYPMNMGAHKSPSPHHLKSSI